jgi:outer membrane immunogenic protein
MKCLIPIAAALALLAGVAHAADLRTAPVYTKAPLAPVAYNWSGIYLVGHADYAAEFSGATTTVGTIATIDLNQIPHGWGAGGGLEGLIDTGGTFVFGARADIGWLNLKSTGTFASGPTSISLSTASNYLGNFDAVLGMPLGSERRLMVGLVGGIAFGGRNPNLTAAGLCLASPTTSCSQAINDTSIGYNIGGFAEYAIKDTPVTLFMEANYSHLGDKALTIGGGASPLITSTARFDFIEQMFGVKWKILGTS